MPKTPPIEPTWTVRGELSAAAIDALAALLVDNYFREHQTANAKPEAPADSSHGQEE